MKLNILTTAALLATAGALMTQSAKAQFTTGGAASANDLILSFSDSTAGNSGITTNYEIDLGQASNYTSATSTVNITNIASDLQAVYGSGWYSDSGLELSVLGGASNGSTAKVIYASDTTTTPDASPGSNSEGTAEANVVKIYTPGSDTSGNPPTNGTATDTFNSVTYGAYKVPTANQFSFATIDPTFSTAVPNLTATFNGSTDPSLYLDTITSTGHTSGTSAIAMNNGAAGYFDISSTGALTYQVQTAQVVPNPPTYALMILGGALLFVWQARRKSSVSL